MGTRLTGLASGMDIDSMVESLLTTKQTKLDEAKKDLKYAEWQQEAYRGVIDDIVDFQETFFDILNKDSYLMSSSTFNSYTAEASIDGASNSAVSVSATSSAATGTHTISNITTAKQDIWTGSDVASMVGEGLVLGDINSGDTIDVSLDGTKQTITLDGGYSTIDDLVTDLQGKIDDAFGSGKVTVGTSGSELSFESIGHTFRATDTNDGDTVLTSLGFSSGDSNVLNKFATLEDANFANDIAAENSTVSFTINGDTFTFDTTSDTVQDVIDQVNGSETANVTLSYSSFTNDFTLTSDDEGEANQITFEDVTGSFLSSGLGIDYATETGHTQTGADATFTLDGVTTTRSSNNFTIDGVKYELNADTTSEVTVTVGTNTESTKETILEFVDQYNALVEKINGLVKEDRDYDYEPLTDAQKEEMTEDEIENWEEKAKEGILSNDTLLTGFMSSMRSAIYSTDISGTSLVDLGITTSKNYDNGGQLVVDEETLDEVLESDPESVEKLFTDSESGLSTTLDSILDQYAKTTGSSKGLLVKKAGVDGTTSENDNYLSDKIDDIDDQVDTLLEKLEEAEDKYYKQFSEMESAISEMNTMSSYIAGWFA